MRLLYVIKPWLTDPYAVLSLISAGLVIAGKLDLISAFVIITCLIRQMIFEHLTLQNALKLAGENDGCAVHEKAVIHSLSTSTCSKL